MNPSLNVISTRLRAQMSGSSSDRMASSGGSLLRPVCGCEEHWSSLGMLRLEKCTFMPLYLPLPCVLLPTKVLQGLKAVQAEAVPGQSTREGPSFNIRFTWSQCGIPRAWGVCEGCSPRSMDTTRPWRASSGAGSRGRAGKRQPHQLGTLKLDKTLVQSPARSAPEPRPCVCKKVLTITARSCSVLCCIPDFPSPGQLSQREVSTLAPANSYWQYFLVPFNAAARGSRWGWGLKLSQTDCSARIASSG